MLGRERRPRQVMGDKPREIDADCGNRIPSAIMAARRWRPTRGETVKKPVKATSLSVRGIVAAIEAGRLTASAVAEAYLEVIAARESEVRAFAYLDPALVAAQAKKLDRAGRRRKSPLLGVPFAVKDIIKTKDQPTECNSPIYR